VGNKEAKWLVVNIKVIKINEELVVSIVDRVGEERDESDSQGTIVATY